MLSSYLKKINKSSFFQKMNKKTDNLLTNVYVLYFVSVIALLDLFYLIMSSEFTFVAIFILIGFLTSFFSKNMIVILCIAASFTNVVKYGNSAGIKREGLSNNENEEHKDVPIVDSSNNDVNANEIDHKNIAKQMLELSKNTENMEDKNKNEDKNKKTDDFSEPKAYTDAGDDTAILNKQAQKLLQEAEKLTEQHNIILEKMQNIGNSAIGGMLGMATASDKK